MLSSKDSLLMHMDRHRLKSPNLSVFDREKVPLTFTVSRQSAALNNSYQAFLVESSDGSVIKTVFN